MKDTHNGAANPAAAAAGYAAHGDSALAHLSNALDDLDSSPDQRPVPLIKEAMHHVRAMLAAGTAAKAPAVPDGMALVPDRLTAENGAKGALLGEFSERIHLDCIECGGGEEDGSEHCEACNGAGSVSHDIAIEWTTIKAIYAAAIAHFAAPKSPGAAV